MGCCVSSSEQECTAETTLSKENELLRRENDALRGSIVDDPVHRDFECKICFDSLVATVFLPCGHCMACRKCGTQFSRCPLCQAPIQNLTYLTIP